MNLFWLPSPHLRTLILLCGVCTCAYDITPAQAVGRRRARDQRTHWLPWNLKHPLLAPRSAEILAGNKPNILFIVADDLGYGDLSVAPFSTPRHGSNQSSTRGRLDWPCYPGGYLTPNLQRLADNGIRLTNFHAAAPVCSPARASLLTGLFAWRLGALNAFEVGNDYSQRNMFLPQVPTLPEVLRSAGYYTAHAGKWHLGGMREETVRARETESGCVPPGPNQHGFEDYVSMFDGPMSPRYQTLMRAGSNLHEHGHEYFVSNDVEQPTLLDASSVDGYTVLSDREAQEAVRMMKHAVDHHPGQPWYVQLWFNAPHSPWTELRPGRLLFDRLFADEQSLSTAERTCLNRNKKAFSGSLFGWGLSKNKQSAEKDRIPLSSTREFQYKTMVASMDRSIGYLLDQLAEMKLDENTIVVFTSDNGPERNAGSAGPYREMKRSLLEGGIRVPTIIQWPGMIRGGSESEVWGAHTDLVPTILDAVSIALPANMPVDGFSILPLLLRPALTKHRLSGSHSDRLAELVKSANFSAAGESVWTKDLVPAPPRAALEINKRQLSSMRHPTEAFKKYRNSSEILVKDVQTRLYLYHRSTEKVNERDDAVGSAAVLGGRYKLVTTTNNMCAYRFYDLHLDPMEQFNLIDTRHPAILNFSASAVLERIMAAQGSVRIVSPSINMKFDLCPNLHKSIGSRGDNNGLFLRDDFEMQATIRNIKRYMNFNNIRVLNRCDNEDTVAACVVQVVDHLVGIIRLMATPLRKFVIFGAHGQREYMQRLIKTKIPNSVLWVICEIQCRQS